MKYWLKILLLSSLALMIALAPASTQPSTPASPPGSPQESTQESQPALSSPLIYGPYSQEEMVRILQAGSQAAAKTAAQAAVDVAVPLGVKAAVAQKEGELAAANALASWNAEEKQRYACKAGLWRGLTLAAAGALVGSLLDRSSPQGTVYGLGSGVIGAVVWGIAEAWLPLRPGS